MSSISDDEHRFWEHATPLLSMHVVTRSTMMGLPCLRINGAFFASWDRNSGSLLVKLPEAEVDRMVASGDAASFAPAGRRFREWAAISPDREEAWPDLLEQAMTHVSLLPAKPVAQRRRNSVLE